MPTRIQLFESMNQHHKFLHFLVQHGLINPRYCPFCDNKISLNIEKKYFKCQHQKLYSRCKYKEPLFSEDSLFYCSKLRLKTMIFLLYEFVNTTPVKQVAFQYQIHESSVSRNFKLFRHMTNELLKENYPDAIGGEGVIVEWDECLIVKNKNHQGRRLAA